MQALGNTCKLVGFSVCTKYPPLLVNAARHYATRAPKPTPKPTKPTPAAKATKSTKSTKPIPEITPKSNKNSSKPAPKPVHKPAPKPAPKPIGKPTIKQPEKPTVKQTKKPAAPKDSFPQETVAKPKKVKETEIKGVSVTGTNIESVPEVVIGNATPKESDVTSQKSEEDFDIDEYEDDEYEYGEATYHYFKANVEKLGPKAYPPTVFIPLQELFSLEQSPSAMRIFGFMVTCEVMVLGYLKKVYSLSFLRDMHSFKFNIKESILDAFVEYLANNPNKREEEKFNEVLHTIRPAQDKPRKASRR